jgi:hypothetical protein
MQLKITSTSAIQPLANEVEDEDDIEFVFEIEAIGSQVASNLDLDATWALFIPQFLVNQSMWYPLCCVSNYWAFFLVNDNAKINSINLQVMRCILCHPIPVNVDSNGKNKGLVNYNTQYGTSDLKKHVTDKHVKEYRRWGLFVV